MKRKNVAAMLMVTLASWALTGLQAGEAAGSDATTVVVPSFWDPAAAPAKPSLDGLTSIRFITADDYPPFDFTLADGTPTGFDVDLARAICDELGVTCTIQQRAWDTVLSGLEASQGDAAIASLAISETSRRRVDFTAAYFKTPAHFIARRIAPLPGDLPVALAGKSVAVQAGTAHEAYLRLFFPAAVVKPYPTLAAARNALMTGDVAALLGDAVASSIWMSGSDAGDCCAFTGGPYTESRFFGTGAGIAVRKGNVRLRQALDYALARVAAKGHYADLYLKYFPVGIY